MSINTQDDTAIVLGHPEFFQLERMLRGNTWTGEPPCEYWQVGVGLLPGRVVWESGATREEALAKMAARIRSNTATSCGSFR